MRSIEDLVSNFVYYWNVDRANLLVAAFALLTSVASVLVNRKSAHAAARSANIARENVAAAERSANAAEQQAGIAAHQATQTEKSVEVAKGQAVDALTTRVVITPQKPETGWKFGIRKPQLSRLEPPAPHPEVEQVPNRRLSKSEKAGFEIFYIVPAILYNDDSRTARIYANRVLHFYSGEHPLTGQHVGVPHFSPADDCYILYPQQFAFLEMRPHKMVCDLAKEIQRDGYGDHTFAKCSFHILPGVFYARPSIGGLQAMITTLEFCAKPIEVTENDSGELDIELTSYMGALSIIPHYDVQPG